MGLHTRDNAGIPTRININAASRNSRNPNKEIG